MMNLPLGATIHCGRCQNAFRKPGPGQVVPANSAAPSSVTNVGITIAPASATTETIDRQDQTRQAASNESDADEVKTERPTEPHALCGSPTAALAAVDPKGEMPSNEMSDALTVIDLPSSSGIADIEERISEMRRELRDTHKSISRLRRSLVAVVLFQTVLVAAVVLFTLATYNYRRMPRTLPGSTNALTSRSDLRRWTDNRGRAILARLISASDDYFYCPSD